MSAFIVPEGTITAIVRTGLRYGMGSLSSASLTGQALIAENIASVSYRYPDCLASGERLPGQRNDRPATIQRVTETAAYMNPMDYRYTPRGEDEPALDPGKVLSAISSYTYQSCEHPQWGTSAAQEFVGELTRRIVRRGYERVEGVEVWAGDLSAYYADPASDAERLIESALDSEEA